MLYNPGEFVTLPAFRGDDYGLMRPGRVLTHATKPNLTLWRTPMDQANNGYTAESLRAPTPKAEPQESTIATVTAPMHLPPAEQEDATDTESFMRLCAQHAANRQAVMDSPLDPEDSPNWPAYTATHDAISGARPRNLPELAAKARAAKAEAFIGHGKEDPTNGAALDWAWQLVNDLIRLGGEAV